LPAAELRTAMNQQPEPADESTLKPAGWVEPGEEEELQPKRWTTRDVPPRRTGFNVILLLCTLLASLFVALYVSIAVSTARSTPPIKEYLGMTFAASTTETQRTISKDALDKVIAEHDLSNKALFDFTEKVGLALISLLSAVVGYTLKGETSPQTET
jgi:hypothetical protein